METNDYIKKLEEEVETLKNKLKSYTAPSRSKIYYEKHKEQIKQKVKEYKEKTNYIYEVPPEKKKEYARTAYLNKKITPRNTNSKRGSQKPYFRK